MRDLAEVLARRAALKPPGKAIIEGEFVGAASGATFSNVSPRDGEQINDVTACDAADIDHAVKSSRAAFEDGRWRELTPKQKKAVLFKLADLMQADAENLALLECLDTGKPISEALNVDIPLSINSARWYGEALDKIYGEVGPAPEGRFSYATHEPLGVIGAIVPWNFPLHMAMWKVAPALAMGNSVVLKPAEQSPLTALRMGELALQAGVPPGVLNVTPGLGETAGQAIGRHMDIDMVAFTGSGPVGRRLMSYSGESNLKRVSLELGGKSPQIVFADCPDFDGAAQAAAWGVFYNQGEVCTAASRLLVHESVAQMFQEKVLAAARVIKVGDPLDPQTSFGAMVSERQMQTALRYIDTAKGEGAKLQLGGAQVRQESGGFYVEPTVFSNVLPGTTLAREEVFGPVLAIMTFKTPEEAFRLANDTNYGLAAGAWTSNVDLAFAAAKKLRAGLVWINGWDICDITMPFGGFKQSGFGRDRSLHAMHKYADLKAVSFALKGAV